MKKNDFKIKLIVGLLFIIGITSFLSCEKDNSEVRTNENDYLKLGLSVKSALENIGKNLREQNSTFINRIDVKIGAKQFFSEESSEYDAFLNAYDETINGSFLKTTVNNEIDPIISDIDGKLINSNSSIEFIDYLEEKFEEVSVSDIDSENKDVLLKYIISYKTSLEFINDNVDLIANQSGQLKSINGWWNSWGRCAAGIVGGAGLGALTGGAAASVIPVLGTTAGLIVGGVSGGLSGAAAAC